MNGLAQHEVFDMKSTLVRFFAEEEMIFVKKVIASEAYIAKYVLV